MYPVRTGSGDEKRAIRPFENPSATAYCADRCKDPLGWVEQRHIAAIECAVFGCNRKRVGQSQGTSTTNCYWYAGEYIRRRSIQYSTMPDCSRSGCGTGDRDILVSVYI